MVTPRVPLLLAESAGCATHSPTRWNGFDLHAAAFRRTRRKIVVAADNTPRQSVRRSSVRAADGDRERPADLSHRGGARLSEPPHEPALLDGLHVIEVDC